MQSMSLQRVLEAGDKVVHTDELKRKHVLTYTGTRREVKYVLYDFFTTEKGETVFFSPSEVEQMKNYEN
jgi:hypothetical protein